MAGIIEALGASLLNALVAIRAGLIIAAAAFLELAIAAANESIVVITNVELVVNPPLAGFFEIIAVAFGVLSVLTGLLFLSEQVWARLRR